MATVKKGQLISIIKKRAKGAWKRARDVEPKARGSTLPGGLINAVCRLISWKLDKDKNKNPYIDIKGIVAEPSDFEGVQVHFFYSFHKTKTKTVQDKWDQFSSDLQLMGVNVAKIKEEDDIPTQLDKDITKKKPYINFNTWQPPDGGRVMYFVQGEAKEPDNEPDDEEEDDDTEEEEDEDSEDEEEDSEDEDTEDEDEEEEENEDEEEEERPRKKKSGGGKKPPKKKTRAAAEDDDDEEEDEEEDNEEEDEEEEPRKKPKKGRPPRKGKPSKKKKVEEEDEDEEEEDEENDDESEEDEEDSEDSDFVPKKKQVWGYKVKGKGKMLECIVMDVDKKAKTVTLKEDAKNGKTFKKVKWDQLLGAEDDEE